MERRYLAFILASFAIIMLYQVWMAPQPPVQPKAPEPQQQAQDVVRRPSLDAHLPSILPPADAEAEEEAKQQAPYFVLGSLAQDSPYRMAVVFDARGATIRRLTLSSSHYTDLDDAGGYWGDLELSGAAGGARVEIVPPGSPAAEAGLQRGDILTAITPAKGSDDQSPRPIGSAADAIEALRGLNAAAEAQLTYLREGNQQTTQIKLTRRPLDLIRPEAENILLHEPTLPPNFEHHPSMELTIASLGPAVPAAEVLQEANQQLATGVWLAEQVDRNTIEFRKTIRALNLEAVKRFRLVEVPEEERPNREYPGYHLEFDVEFTNLGSELQTVSYRLQGPNGLPVEGWWYAQKVGRSWGAYGIRDMVMRYHGAGSIDFSVHKISNNKVKPLTGAASVAFVSVDAQYFASAIIPNKTSQNDKWYAIIEPSLASTKVDAERKIKDRYNNTSFRLVSSELTVPPGQSMGHEATLFAGPKAPALLDRYLIPDGEGQSLEPLVYYGYAGKLGIPQFMVWLLSFFYSFVGNHGLAIIMLTVLVRGCILPLSRRQAKSMLKMQALKPEMDRIAAKYKDDLQARAQAQRELMAKNNCNPMGGCWLMLLQLPIFIGLYRALMVDVDLRQAPLIPGLEWCSNLAAPDRLFDWSGMFPLWFNNGEGMLALGPYFNLLPILTVVLFLVQQKLFMPPATDDQTRMTQKVMQVMMIFMAFMFFKVASGLCLYFIASSLWGIAERCLLAPPKGPDGESIIPAGDTSSPGPTRKRTPKTEGHQIKRNGKRRKKK